MFTIKPNLWLFLQGQQREKSSWLFSRCFLLNCTDRFSKDRFAWDLGTIYWVLARCQAVHIALGRCLPSTGGCFGVLRNTFYFFLLSLISVPSRKQLTELGVPGKSICMCKTTKVWKAVYSEYGWKPCVSGAGHEDANTLFPLSLSTVGHGGIISKQANELEPRLKD